MSKPPSRAYQGHRYQTDDPYAEYTGRDEPVGAGYQPPAPRRPDDHNGYRPYGADGREHGETYDRQPAYGGPDSYQRVYDDERAYGGYRPEAAYGAYPDQRNRSYPQPPAQHYTGYGHPGRPAYPTAAHHRVDPLPALDDGPARPSRRARKVLLALAVALVLAVGAGTALVLLRTDHWMADTGPARLTTPDTLAGRPRITDGELQNLADELVTTIKRNVPEAIDTVGAFYGDPAKKNMIMVAGAAGRVSDPARQLDRALQEMATGGLAVRNVTSAEPGPLGGVAKCGDATADGVAMGVCAWSDHGSLVLVVVYFANGSQAKAELAGIREAIEQRG